jgi:putative MATE family efflux protein
MAEQRPEPEAILSQGVYRAIFKLAWPAILENVLFTVVFVVDAIMVAQLGSVALAAVGLSGTINFAFTSVFGSMQVAALSLVARSVGAGNRSSAEAYGRQALLIGFLLGSLLVGLAIFLPSQMLRLMGGEQDVVSVGRWYMMAVMGVSPVRMLFFVGAGILRGSGDTRTPMFVTAIVNTCNIVLNWLLIFGIGPFPRLEVLGAGIATGFAFFLGGILMLFSLRKRMGFPFLSFLTRTDRLTLRDLLKVALPSSMEQILLRIGFLGFVRIVTSLGTIAYAAHIIAFRIESIAFMPGFGISIAAGTLVGQAVGARNMIDAERNFRKTTLVAVLIMSSIAAILFVLARYLVIPFNPEPEVGRLAVVCVMLAALEQPPLAIFFTMTGGLRGAGDTRSPMIIAIVGSFIRIALVYVAVFVLRLGLPGVWLATIPDWSARAIMAYGFFKFGRWKKISFARGV